MVSQFTFTKGLFVSNCSFSLSLVTMHHLPHLLCQLGSSGSQTSLYRCHPHSLSNRPLLLGQCGSHTGCVRIHTKTNISKQVTEEKEQGDKNPFGNTPSQLQHYIILNRGHLLLH